MYLLNDFFMSHFVSLEGWIVGGICKTSTRVKIEQVRDSELVKCFWTQIFTAWRSGGFQKIGCGFQNFSEMETGVPMFSFAPLYRGRLA